MGGSHHSAVPLSTGNAMRKETRGREALGMFAQLEEGRMESLWHFRLGKCEPTEGRPW